jgi:FkbM family methyltransferase
VRAGNTEPLAATLAGTACRLNVDGRRVCLDGSQLAGAREIYGRRVYEALPGFAVTSGDVVVDLGANVGVFTTLAATRAARVIAVDAQMGLLRTLERNVAATGVRDRVTVIHGLVGATTGVLSDPEARHRSPDFGGVEPPIYTLRDLFAAQGVDRVDLLKMDIEGAEFALFAETSWLPTVQRIVMEVHAAFGDPDALAEGLRAAGFDVTLLDDDLRRLDALAGRNGYLYARRR